jgi:hypothetical protein
MRHKKENRPIRHFYVAHPAVNDPSIFQSRNEPEIEIYLQYGMSLKTACVSNTG